MTSRTGNLVLATWAFAISFWAWNLIAPLAARYAADLGLSAAATSLLVATPVLVGAIGRILVGASADRFGGRRMFTVLLLLTAPFVILVAVAGELRSYPLLIIFGFFLGIAGTTFAVGIPFAGGWFEPARRGFATGVFGAGMGGTALSAFFTPRLVGWIGYLGTHLLVAGALVITAVLVWLLMRDPPGWRPQAEPVLPKLAGALRLGVTWQLSALYAVAFGGFVAFCTYLPTYLKDVYGFDLAEAGTRTAGFAIAAVLCRPLGGMLSDRIGPKAVAGAAFAGAAVLAVLMSLKPAPEIPAGTVFVLMAASLGLGTGAVFAWVAARAPAERVGSVAGIVGAVGGLGGFFPPLVMGATYDATTHSYTVGLLLLCVVATGALIYTVLAFRGIPRPPTAGP